MSTSARKARKRAGIPFVRTPKTVTPPIDRHIAVVEEPGRGSHLLQRAIRRLEYLFAEKRKPLFGKRRTPR